MFKRSTFILMLTLLFLSCSSTKGVRTSKKIIKGSWELSTVEFSDYGTFKIVFFGDVSKNCLEGSQWNFIPNNNTGTYEISGDSCSNGIRNFVFTIQEVNKETQLYDFLLKPTDEKHKSETNKGYRVELVNLTDSAMKWAMNTSIDGKNIKLYMNFKK